MWGARHATDYHATVNRFVARAGSVLVALAAAIVVVALSIVLFLNPVWVAFEQGRSDAAGWTGYSAGDLRAATDGILSDLVFGPPNFEGTVGGQPVLDARERSHMADVRGVFTGFALLSLASAILLVAAAWLTRASGTFWGAIRGGMTALAIGVVVVGLVGVFAFDAAFEVFHRLFFAGGTYLFDPRTSRLVQLFPDQFWFETSLAVGGLILALAAGVWRLAGRRTAPGGLALSITHWPAEAHR